MSFTTQNVTVCLVLDPTIQGTILEKTTTYVVYSRVYGLGNDTNILDVSVIDLVEDAIESLSPTGKIGALQELVKGAQQLDLPFDVSVYSIQALPIFEQGTIYHVLLGGYGINEVGQSTYYNKVFPVKGLSWQNILDVTFDLAVAEITSALSYGGQYEVNYEISGFSVIQ